MIVRPSTEISEFGESGPYSTWPFEYQSAVEPTRAMANDTMSILTSRRGTKSDRNWSPAKKSAIASDGIGDTAATTSTSVVSTSPPEDRKSPRR